MYGPGGKDTKSYPCLASNLTQPILATSLKTMSGAKFGRVMKQNTSRAANKYKGVFHASKNKSCEAKQSLAPRSSMSLTPAARALSSLTTVVALTSYSVGQVAPSNTSHWLLLPDFSNSLFACFHHSTTSFIAFFLCSHLTIFLSSHFPRRFVSSLQLFLSLCLDLSPSL